MKKKPTIWERQAADRRRRFRKFYTVAVEVTEHGYRYEVHQKRPNGARPLVSSGNAAHRQAAHNWADRAIEEHMGYRALVVLERLQKSGGLLLAKLADKREVAELLAMGGDS